MTQRVALETLQSAQHTFFSSISTVKASFFILVQRVRQVALWIFSFFGQQNNDHGSSAPERVLEREGEITSFSQETRRASQISPSGEDVSPQDGDDYDPGPISTTGGSKDALASRCTSSGEGDNTNHAAASPRGEDTPLLQEKTSSQDGGDHDLGLSSTTGGSRDALASRCTSSGEGGNTNHAAASPGEEDTPPLQEAGRSSQTDTPRTSGEWESLEGTDLSHLSPEELKEEYLRGVKAALQHVLEQVRAKDPILKSGPVQSAQTMVQNVTTNVAEQPVVKSFVQASRNTLEDADQTLLKTTKSFLQAGRKTICSSPIVVFVSEFVRNLHQNGVFDICEVRQPLRQGFFETLSMVIPSLVGRVDCGRSPQSFEDNLKQEDRPEISFFFLEKQGTLRENHATLLILDKTSQRVRFYDPRGRGIKKEDLIVAPSESVPFQRYLDIATNKGWTVNEQSDQSDHIQSTVDGVNCARFCCVKILQECGEIPSVGSSPPEVLEEYLKNKIEQMEGGNNEFALTLKNRFEQPRDPQQLVKEILVATTATCSILEDQEVTADGPTS